MTASTREIPVRLPAAVAEPASAAGSMVYDVKGHDAARRL